MTKTEILGKLKTNLPANKRNELLRIYNIMKTYTIESEIISIEIVTVKANNKRDALKYAENNPNLIWEPINNNLTRNFISIL